MIPANCLDNCDVECFAWSKVMMVCILNRIPVFVVGKPGNSKSLALRIIHANLRGSDSQHELWRRYPRIYVISYQGSDVSTSEGVTKVFEKAEQYKKKQLSQGNSEVLVHFDEIGLAEASPNNPLKVLHAYLEPGYPKDRPDYAVVGLSNFPLDAAKMNRGIALVRPPPNKSDLQKTLEALCDLAQQSNTHRTANYLLVFLPAGSGEGTRLEMEKELREQLAIAYCAYYQDFAKA